jgi:N-formylglutamate deformylase
MRHKNVAESGERLWLEHEGEGPLFATAIHAGHDIRGELIPFLALDEATRLREEDPYTDRWVKIVPGWIVATRSRFEVDLNRERNEAVYSAPEMAWGLHLWKMPLPNAQVEHSLKEYDAFYQELKQLLDHVAQRYRHFIILDLHAYNYRREGPGEPPADPDTHPEVNVGTGTMDRMRCGRVVERFMQELREYEFLGRHLDVRENVKCRGRELARWIHDHYPDSACVLSVEFKKFFMDEWSGTGYEQQIAAIREALHATIPGILEELAAMEQQGD